MSISIVQDGATARATLARMITASRITQAVYVAAKLGIADCLAGAPRSSDALAVELGTHPGALRRLLLALTSIGIVEHTASDEFALTSIGSYLRRDTPESLHAPTLLFGGERFWDAWGRLSDAVRTGEPTLGPRSDLAFLERHVDDPAWGALFDGAMSAHTTAVTSAIIAAYDFSRFTHVVDVGGGRATLLAAILNAHPAVRGTVFDLPPVVHAARAALDAVGLSRRCDVVAGDFFAAVPTGADAYLLKVIIHDWNDERSVAILRKCREAIAPGGTLLLVERVTPARIEARPDHEEVCFVDLNMLVITGGLERTEADYETLLRRAGFRLTRIVPTASPFSVIEARGDDLGTGHFT